METAPTPRKEHDKPRRRWEWLLLLLALLMSCGCVFCASQLALSFWPNRLTSANMLAKSQADYMGESGGFQFAALDPKIGAQAATDSARLNITPTGASGSSPVRTGLLPPTPTPTATTRPQPALAEIPSEVSSIPAASSTPAPVADNGTTSASDLTPTPSPGGDTSTPQPTSTSIPPTATSLPTSTLQPTATVPPTSTVPPTPTPSPPPPTPTPPPPTPTSPPPPPVNNPPVAVNDAVTIDEDKSTAPPIDVLGNDSDPDGLVPGSVMVVSGPNNGTTSVNAGNGRITYTPNLNYYGPDTFTYQVCDTLGACSTATVTVTVNPVNDPPVAMPDTKFTPEDHPGDTIFVLNNDTDPDSLTLTIISAGPALSGTVTINAASITYTPNLDINGIDVFTYTISDGILTDTTTVTVTIIPANDTPIANQDSYTTTMGITLTVTAPGVLANDTDVDIGDTLTVIVPVSSPPMSGTLTMNPDGSFQYVPNPAFVVGVDTFTYQIQDFLGFASNITTVTITIP